MIERLTTGLRRLASLPFRGRGDVADARLFGDCADAVRLELDCPQQVLTAPQRLALSRLSDLLEQADVSRPDLVEAARRASLVLGLATPTPPDGVPRATATRS